MATPKFSLSGAGDFLNGILDVATGETEQSANTLDKNQTMRESGGRQFDEAGNPLVGRRSDGSLPKPAERAYGIAQIQVRTARETARIHGIPFDETKLMQDAAYNKRLGDLHMDDLRRKYGGDEVLAQAAYHSGGPNVDRAIRKYGRENFDRGLGKDGRAYVAAARAEQGGGTKSGSKGEGSVATPPPLPAAPAATQGDKDRAAGGFQGKIVNVFDQSIEQGLGELFGERGTEITKGANMLDTIVADTDRIQEERLAALTETVETKREVNDQLAAANQNMQDRAAAIFVNQQELLRRRQEVRRMNPIARIFKGVTDPKYNEVIMREEELNNRDELETLGQQYKTHRELLGHQMEYVTDAYALDQATNTQRINDNEQDIRLMGQVISMSGMAIDNIKEGIGTQEMIMSLRDQAKDRTLNKMNESLMLDLAGQAQANGGTVEVEGMTFTTRELTEGAGRAEQVRLNLHNQRNAVQMGDMQMADVMETKTMESMSDSQIDEAIAADGSFQGTQLNVTKLAAEKAKRDQLGVKGGKLVGGDINAEMTIQSMDRMSRSIVAESNALKGLFGHVPSDWTELDANHGAVLQSIAAVMKDESITPQAKVAALAKMRPQIAAMEAAREAKLKQMAASFGGTNRALTLVAENYLLGRPAPPQESANGIIAMSRGGVPAGAETSPEAKAILGQVGKMISEYDVRVGAGGTKDPAALQKSVLTYIQGRARTVVMESVLDDLPVLARSVRDGSGKVHPFAQITQSDWRATRAAGATKGSAIVANAMGISVEQLDAVLKNPGTPTQPSELMRAIRAHKPEFKDITVGQISAQRATAQINATVQLLDSQFGNDKFRPSTALANLLANPEVQKRASTAAFGGRGFVDFTMRSATGGQGQVTLSAYRDKIVRGQAADGAQRLRDVANPALEASTNPKQRVSLVLNQIDGVNRDQRSQFGSYLLSQMGNVPATRVGGGDLFGKQIQPNFDYWTRMDKLVATPIEGNPTLESIRKKVATKWGIASDNIRRAFEE